MITKFSSLQRSRSFVNFKMDYSLWRVKVGENINYSSCSCPKFRSYNYCKHLIVALLKLKKIEVPIQYSLKKIVSKNSKRGRPKKAGPALETD